MNLCFQHLPVGDIMHQTRVYLVGAGPGDPELLTVKALRLLKTVDVVVYDRLVGPAILEQIAPGVKQIYVGKQSGHHVLPQDEINEQLVNLAKSGRTVVRLKGGDPFIFGRGSEEAEYLARHDIPFEVVPGITAASACATYGGIPLTHRGVSRSVEFIAGHCRNDEPLTLDWQSLAREDKTLVVYMGLANVQAIQDGLINAGLPGETPAAIIENGASRRQRRHLTSLATLHETVQQQQCKAPAVLIIGKVVGFANILDWYEATDYETSYGRKASYSRLA